MISANEIPSDQFPHVLANVRNRQASATDSLWWVHLQRESRAQRRHDAERSDIEWQEASLQVDAAAVLQQRARKDEQNASRLEHARELEAQIGERGAQNQLQHAFKQQASTILIKRSTPCCLHARFTDYLHRPSLSKFWRRRKTRNSGPMQRLTERQKGKGLKMLKSLTEILQY